MLAELERFAPLAAVYGNMDDAALRETLPKERVAEIGGARIGMVHIPGRSSVARTGSSAASPTATRSCTGTRTSPR